MTVQYVYCQSYCDLRRYSDRSRCKGENVRVTVADTDTLTEVGKGENVTVTVTDTDTLTEVGKAVNDSTCTVQTQSHTVFWVVYSYSVT